MQLPRFSLNLHVAKSVQYMFRNRKMRKYLKEDQQAETMGLFKTSRSVFNGLTVNFRFLINGHRTVRSCVVLVANA